MIGRRDFIAGLGGVVAWPFTRPLAAEAQRRVGFLSLDDNQSYFDAFREGLATFGWVEGHNLRLDYRFAGDPSGLAADAEELVALRPDVIFALTGPAARAVQQRTSVIPIVFVGRGDPTSDGAVRSAARPEGNMTGFANIFGSLGGRWLELFKEAVPRLTRVADIYVVNELSIRNVLALRTGIAMSVIPSWAAAGRNRMCDQCICGPAERRPAADWSFWSRHS